MNLQTDLSFLLVCEIPHWLERGTKLYLQGCGNFSLAFKNIERKLERENTKRTIFVSYKLWLLHSTCSFVLFILKESPKVKVKKMTISASSGFGMLHSMWNFFLCLVHLERKSKRESSKRIIYVRCGLRRLHSMWTFFLCLVHLEGKFERESPKRIISSSGEFSETSSFVLFTLKRSPKRKAERG